MQRRLTAEYLATILVVGLLLGLLPSAIDRFGPVALLVVAAVALWWLVLESPRSSR